MARSKRTLDEGAEPPNKILRDAEYTPPTEDAPSGVYEAVFLTTELLEQILLELPMKDVLLNQRVCKKWRDIIAKNDRLQEKLFFKPVAERSRWSMMCPVPTGFQTIRRTWTLDELSSVTDVDHPRKLLSFTMGTLNPLLFRLVGCLPLEGSQGRFERISSGGDKFGLKQ